MLVIQCFTGILHRLPIKRLRLWENRVSQRSVIALTHLSYVFHSFSHPLPHAHTFPSQFLFETGSQVSLNCWDQVILPLLVAETRGHVTAFRPPGFGGGVPFPFQEDDVY